MESGGTRVGHIRSLRRARLHRILHRLERLRFQLGTQRSLESEGCRLVWTVMAPILDHHLLGRSGHIRSNAFWFDRVNAGEKQEVPFLGCGGIKVRDDAADTELGHARARHGQRDEQAVSQRPGRHGPVAFRALNGEDVREAIAVESHRCGN